jgi:hypothetical protein
MFWRVRYVYLLQISNNLDYPFNYTALNQFTNAVLSKTAYTMELLKTKDYENKREKDTFCSAQS